MAMLDKSDPGEFLRRNRISQEDWDKCGLTWDVLCAIARDHDTNRNTLSDTADLFARTLQRIPGVHSVRYRVKDTEHLLEKIIRKAANGVEKYRQVTEASYFDVVADLVGVRALHLFKDDCFAIDTAIRSTWNFNEPPVAYIRDGDPPEISSRFQNIGMAIKSHKAGYRSVHYVCATQPLQRKVLVEIQVRTIFEEGWSEIDHRVRYPNYSDNQLVAYFLTIFNRLAGSADEMGTFVQGLTTALTAQDLQIENARREKDQALEKMSRALQSLSEVRKQDLASRQQIDSLRSELSKLQSLNSPTGGLLGSANPLASSILRDQASWRDLLKSGALSDAFKNLPQVPMSSAIEQLEQGGTGLLDLPPSTK